jgi:2-succinyl-5-enolpyruvyl-6-hydroxy-3-cyclohexene-1-carboxylate synthase
MPETVIYVGGNTVSKRLRQWLRSLPESVEQVLVSPDGVLHDVSQHTSLLVEGCAETVINDLCEALPQSSSTFLEKWQQLRLQVETSHRRFTPAYSSMRATQLLEQTAAAPSTFSYANSMAVRYGCVYAHHFIHCNRGLNGIEGTLSTTVGLALAHPTERIYCVIGDLSAFYDQTALSQQELTGNLRILLLNNSGGAIFHSFPQLASSPARDTLVSAAHRLTAEGLCTQCGITYIKASDEASLKEGITRLVHDEGTRPVLLEVLTDPNQDIRVYKEYHQFIIDNYGVDKH